MRYTVYEAHFRPADLRFAVLDGKRGGICIAYFDTEDEAKDVASAMERCKEIQAIQNENNPEYRG